MRVSDLVEDRREGIWKAEYWVEDKNKCYQIVRHNRDNKWVVFNNGLGDGTHIFIHTILELNVFLMDKHTYTGATPDGV